MEKTKLEELCLQCGDVGPGCRNKKIICFRRSSRSRGRRFSRFPGRVVLLIGGELRASLLSGG